MLKNKTGGETQKRQTDKKTEGQMNRRTNGQKDKWTEGQMDRRTNGQSGCWR